MSDLTPEAIKHHIKIYVRVFVALAVLTIITVAISYLHLPTEQGVALALIVATIKGALVAGFFMHLFAEKRIIGYILGLTVFFFFFLLLYPTLFHY